MTSLQEGHTSLKSSFDIIFLLNHHHLRTKGAFYCQENSNVTPRSFQLYRSFIYSYAVREFYLQSSTWILWDHRESNL